MFQLRRFERDAIESFGSDISQLPEFRRITPQLLTVADKLDAASEEGLYDQLGYFQ